MQPEGAITSLPTGTIGDMAFSPDGKTIYVARGGVVAAYNAATGASIGNWTIGSQLGGIDVSADGKYLVATERTAGPNTGTAADPKSEVSVYRLDLGAGASTKFSTTATGSLGAFHDASFLPNGTVLLTQSYTGSGGTPLTTLDFAKGEFTRGQELFQQDGTLTASPDKTHIALLPSNASDAPVLVYEAGKGVTARHQNFADGVMGFNSGVQAISSSGDLVAQGVGLTVYDGDLKLIVKLGELYPYLPAVSGMAFSPSGDKLYLLSGLARQVIVLETEDWSVVAGYSVPGAISNAGNFGDSLLISADGKRLALAGDATVQLVDLAKATSDGGTSGKDTLVGDGGANYLFGFEGDDSLDGKGGEDFLYGGAGDDTYYVDTLKDTVVEYANEGNDRVVASVSGYTLPTEIESLQLAGAAVDAIGNDRKNTLIGNELGNRLVGAAGDDSLEGKDGDDRLDGGTGDDKMVGGKGDDVYVVDSAKDTVIELTDEGFDTVVSSLSYTLGDNLEGLTLEGGAEALNGTGNALGNTIQGNGGDNKLVGLGGADALIGGAGNDTLDGGVGNDLIDGGAGVDLALFDGKRSDYQIVTVGSGFSVTDKRPGGGTDFVVNVESLRFADAEIAAVQLRADVDRLSSDWRMFAGDGFVGKIDAGGSVVGSLAKQDITVLDTPGQVVFDSSFNRGGDVIRLSGDANDWFVARDASNAVLLSGATIVVVPLGAGVTSIVFADGMRELRIDATTQSPRLGDQAFTGEFAPVRADADGPVPTASGDDAATSRLFLTAGGDAVISGDYSVIGTAEVEQVTVLAGSVRLDTSFNLGGDTIVLDALSNTFTAARSGSNAVLHNATIDLVAPAGVKGMELSFDDGDRTVRIDQTAGAIMIETQPLTIAPLPLATIA